MTIPKRLEKALDRYKIDYEIERHPWKATSCEIAEVEHVPGREFAKVVMANADGRDIMVVIPATHRVDLLKLGAALNTDRVRIEEEAEFKGLFPDCEVGAMPAVGWVYRVPTYMDQTLADADVVLFNAGSHTECIRIGVEDLVRVTKPVIGDFSVPNH